MPIIGEVAKIIVSHQKPILEPTGQSSMLGAFYTTNSNSGFSSLWHLAMRASTLVLIGNRFHQGLESTGAGNGKFIDHLHKHTAGNDLFYAVALSIADYLRVGVPHPQSGTGFEDMLDAAAWVMEGFMCASLRIVGTWVQTSTSHRCPLSTADRSCTDDPVSLESNYLGDDESSINEWKRLLSDRYGWDWAVWVPFWCI